MGVTGGERRICGHSKIEELHLKFGKEEGAERSASRVSAGMAADQDRGGFDRGEGEITGRWAEELVQDRGGGPGGEEVVLLGGGEEED